MALAALACAAPSAGQNVLLNSGFDHDLASWSFLRTGTVAWLSSDAHQQAGSGSIELASNGGRTFTGQCIGVVPGDYTLRAAFDLTPTPFATGITSIGITVYDAPGCKGNTLTDDGFDPRQNAAPGQTWTAFHQALSFPPAARSVAVGLATQLSTGLSYFAHFDDVRLIEECRPGPSTLCFGLGIQGTFKVEAGWDTGASSGPGNAVALTSRSGYFTFFDPANVELIVKVLNGCGTNHDVWVFAAGLTNVGVELAVTEIATGRKRVYSNALHHPYGPIQDTTAFSTVCP